MKSMKEKEAYWYGHIEAWEKGEVSQAAYCKEAGINFVTFGYWRRRYNRAHKKQSPASLLKEGSKSISSGVSLNSPTLQVLLPNGVRLGLSSEASERQVHAVLQLIQSC